jgi:hypothetical protein
MAGKRLTPEQVRALGLNSESVDWDLPIPVADDRKAVNPEDVERLQLNRPPEVGGLETFVNNATNMIPGGKTVSNFLSGAAMAGVNEDLNRGAVRLTPQAQAEAKRLGITLPGRQERPAGMLQNYREARDMRDVRTAAGDEQNPGAKWAGRGVGLGLSVLAPLPVVRGAPPGATATLGQTAKAGALTGAGYGAAAGFEHGGADWTQGDVGQGVADILVGAGLGAGLGGAFSAGAHAAGPVVAKYLQKWGIGRGRKAITNGADQLSSRQPLSDEAVQQAHELGAFRGAPSTQKIFQRLEGASETLGDDYGKIIQELSDAGIKGPDADKIATELMRRGAALEKAGELNNALPNAYSETAIKILDRAKLHGDDGIPLPVAETMKRSLQRDAKYGKIEETPLNEARRDIARVVREANEQAIEEGAKTATPEIQKRAAEFVPTKKRLGKTIEARNAAERGAARAEQRRLFSLTDNLFAAAGLAGGPATTAGGLAAAGANNIARNHGTSFLANALLNGTKGINTGAAAPQAARLSETLPWFDNAARAKLAELLAPALADEEDGDTKIRMLAEALRSGR